MKPLISRIGAATLASAMSVSLLAACSSGDDGDGVTLRYFWWGSDARHAYTQEILERFEELHPDINVEPEFTSWDDYWNKLSTSAAAQDLPDVMQVVDPLMYPYIENGQLLDLNTVADAAYLERYSESTLSLSTVDDGVYAVPGGVSGFSVAIAPEAFAEAGVEIPDESTWDWDDYIETAAAISAANPDMAGSDIPMFSQVATVWLRQHGENWWSPDGSDLAFTPETLAGYWDWVIRLRDSGGTPSVETMVEAHGAGSSAAQSLLALHKVAMNPALATNQLGELEETSGGAAQLMIYPGESDAQVTGSFVKPGLFYAASAATEHPEEAAMLLDFLNSAEAIELQKFDRGVPVDPAVVEAVSGDLTETELAVADYNARVTALGPEPLPIPNANAGGAMDELYDRINIDVLFDRLTPEEAAQQFYDGLKAEL